MKIDIPICVKNGSSYIVGHLYLKKILQTRIGEKPEVELKFAGKNIKMLTTSQALEQFPECFQDETNKNS